MEENASEIPNPNIDNRNTAKKRSRSTKKSLAIENQQRQHFLNTLLDSDSLPDNVKDILKEEEEIRGSMLKLSSSEVDKFWEHLLGFVRKKVEELLTVCEDDKQDVREVVGATVSLLQYSALIHTTYAADSENFTQMAVVLNLAMVHKDLCYPELQNKICQLSEYCCIKDLNLPGEFFLNTLNFLLDLTLSGKKEEKNGPNIKAMIVRMWEMHVPLARVNLHTNSCEQLVGKLSRVVVSPNYLTWKEGRQFIAFVFTLDVKLIKKFHQSVKDVLPSLKQSQAVHYGEVYYCAWVNGSAEIRQVLEIHCIQNLMTHMFTFPRKKLELSHLGQNVFAILSYLHNHRTTSHFSKILTNLYMPLLWRHLRSGNNIERCNAALVFLDVYPLEKPGAGKAEETDFNNKQHSEMVDLLTDNCHVVRIIAIKGVCNKLSSAWRTFSQEAVQVLMRNLVALANDGSDASVRRTLYVSLPVMFHNEETATYLARILPSLRDYIHDENEKVRRSFVRMLCSIKETESFPIKYWKIVPINHLSARLKLEGPEVGSALAKLLMSNIYSADQPVDKFLARLIKFIETSPLAARKLFQYSDNVLIYKDAVRIMLTILLNLRAHVKRKLEEMSKQQEVEEKKDETSTTNRRKRRSREPLQTINENDQSVPEVSGEDKENNSNTINQVRQETAKGSSPGGDDEYSQPGVAHAMVDIVSLLWVMHSQKLSDSNNEEDHDNLLAMACASIPLFLKYYKGESTYYGVVHLASLVPASKLTPVSTVCSACVSQLRAASEVTPQVELECIIHALCSWNRFADIQDVVIDWLDQAFRCEGLNQSQTKNENLKRRKVRFVAKGGKPMLALRLLDALFYHPLSSKKVIEKSYNQVYELYVYLERIKAVVERRLLLGLPLESPMLSDEFLLKCFYRYSKLILLLHRPEPQPPNVNQTTIEPFDASEIFRQLIDWCFRVIMPLLPQKLEDGVDLSVELLKSTLRTAGNLVDINYAEPNTIVRLAELIKSLLSSECSVWYVEPSLCVIKHLKDFSVANYGAEDEAFLMRRILPSLLSQVLKSLSEVKYTKEQMTDFIHNLFEMRTAMFDVANSLLKLYGPKSDILQSVLKLFTDALVAVIVRDIRQLQLLDPVDKVSDLPSVCGLLIPVVTRPSLAALWLNSVPSSINKLYTQESNLLSAAVSLLHTLAHSGLSLPRAELCQAIQAAYAAVSDFNRESVQSVTSEHDTSTFSNEFIDVKKVALPVLIDLAGFLNCSLS